MNNFRQRGTFQTTGKWIIPGMVGIVKTNLNYDYNQYLLNLFGLQIGFAKKRNDVIPSKEDRLAYARYIIYQWHRDTNHYYGKGDAEVPYEKHLEMVEAEAMKFIYLIPEADRIDVIIGCLAHDAIEDARVTYNDVKWKLGKTVADFAFALQNDKGRNRKERAGKHYYNGIRAVKYGTFIKVCDRLANVRYSIGSGSTMATKYRGEYDEFEKELYDDVYQDMFKALEHLCFFEEEKII